MTKTKDVEYKLWGQAIPNEVIDIAQAFARQGYKLWLVGGCLRSILVVEEPHDWDMCTDATPDEIIRIAGEAGMDTILTGIQHGTVTIMHNNKPFECTTLRKDGNYSDGRRPDSVKFTTSIEEDLARRDFTINAMAFDIDKAYWHKEGKGLYSLDLFIDPFGGRNDTFNKTIRCVADPYDRFQEDALRILRALRFSAQLGFEIEPETSKAIHDCKHLLGNISKERIRDELCKILLSDGCGIDVLMEYEDVLHEIIPVLKNCIGLNNVKDTMKQSEAIRGNADNNEINNELILRLAKLLFISEYKVLQRYDSGGFDMKYNYKAATTHKILKDLKFSNEIVDKVTQLIKYRGVILKNNKPLIKRLLNEIGEKQLTRLIVLKMNPYKCDYDKLDIVRTMLKITRNNECYSLKQLAVNGDDLIELRIPQGKQIGYVLNILLNLVIDEHVENDRYKLLGVVRSIIVAGTPLTKGQ